jgi:hypothetical protein
VRRWRGLKLRRGAYYGAPPSSPVPPPYPPPAIRPAGSLRFAARLLPSARRRWDPGFGQANQGGAWPSWIRQPRATPARGIRTLLSRGRRWDPPWYPPPVIPPPQWLHQAGPLRTPARLLPSARRRWDPGFGQGNQGTAFPQFLHQPGQHPRFAARPVTSRGRRFDPPWAAPAPPVPPQLIRPAGPLRFAARLLPSRRRTWGPAWPQANQGGAWPSWIRQAGTRARYPHVIVSRGRMHEPPWPYIPPPAPQLDPYLLAGTITADLMAGIITADNYAGVIT